MATAAVLQLRRRGTRDGTVSVQHINFKGVVKILSQTMMFTVSEQNNKKWVLL